MVYISSKLEAFDFSGGLSIIKKKKGRNSGNLPYLAVNTYGLNFIKIGGI